MSNSTSIDDLFIVDDEYLYVAIILSQKATRIQEIWDRYITISEEIVGAQGSLIGSRAEKYSMFIGMAKQYLGNKILEIATDSKSNMKNYITMIDEADNALY